MLGNWIFALALWLLRKTQPHSIMTCANRVERIWKAGTWEYRLVARNTAWADGYSREELLEMQKTVWAHERAMGWRVAACFSEQELRELRGPEGGQ